MYEKVFEMIHFILYLKKEINVLEEYSKDKSISIKKKT